MAIGFHPALFDADRFESLQKGDILRRIRFAIHPGRHFDGLLDGYDISSLRIDEESGYPVGSLVDYLFDSLPFENGGCPDTAGLLELLGLLTERHGVLVEETNGQYLGYLNAEQVVQLKTLLDAFHSASEQTKAEITALREILSVAQRQGAGLILVQS